MSADAKSDEQRVNILVTVDEAVGERFTFVAEQLASAGMRGLELMPLGGVVAGQAQVGDLPRLRAVPGVIAVEVDQTFTAD